MEAKMYNEKKIITHTTTIQLNILATVFFFLPAKPFPCYGKDEPEWAHNEIKLSFVNILLAL